MFSHHFTPSSTPSNSIGQPLNISSGSPQNIRRLGYFNAVSSALAHELLNQTGSSSSFFAVDSPESFAMEPINIFDTSSIAGSLEVEGLRTPVRLIEQGRFFPPMLEGEKRFQLRTELSSWVAAAGSTSENLDRRHIAIKIISCFHNKQSTLAIHAPNITNLPTCIGFLSHLQELDLTNCVSLQSLPNVMDSFINLNHLNLTNCQNLTALPATVNALPGAASLFLAGSGVSIANPLQSPLRSL